MHYLITAGEDRTIASFRTGNAISDVLRGHDGAITVAVLGTDGTTLLTGALDGTARLWSLPRPGLLASLDHGRPLRVARLARDGAVISLDLDGTVTRWWPGAGAPERSASLCPWSRCTLDAQGARVVRPRGLAVDSVGLDGDVVATVTHGAPVGLVRAVTGPWVTSVGADHEIALWDDRDGRVLRRVRLPDPVSGIAWSADLERLATTGPAGLAVWSADGALLRRFPTPTRTQVVVAFDPTGARVLGPNETGDAAIWDVASGSLVAVLAGHVTALGDAAFSPDGNFVATVSSESARYHDAATGQVLQYLNRPLGYGDVGSVAFDAAGARLVVAGAETFAQVWDVAPDPRPLAAIRAEIAGLLRYRVTGSVALPVRFAR